MKIKELNKSYRVLSDNEKEIGSFQLDSDGFYYLCHFGPHLINSFFDEMIMME